MLIYIFSSTYTINRFASDFLLTITTLLLLSGLIVAITFYIARNWGIPSSRHFDTAKIIFHKPSHYEEPKPLY